MARILVAGNINVETTLRIDGFPLEYTPSLFPFFGIGSSVSGVGYNVAKALTTLGNRVDLLSIIGADMAGEAVRRALAAAGIDDAHVLPLMAQSCQAVILYDGAGKRQSHSDLKEIQSLRYPVDVAAPLLAACDACVLCNINFARGLLDGARGAGKLVATDLHALGDLDAAYEQDFLRAADILFLSHERLPDTPAEVARALLARSPARLVVVGMGAQGALLAQRGEAPVQVPAVQMRPVVSTIGAGDALFSSFLDGYLRTGQPLAALRRAVRFAGWKIGAASASEGFLSAAELDGPESGGDAVDRT